MLLSFRLPIKNWGGPNLPDVAVGVSPPAQGVSIASYAWFVLGVAWTLHVGPREGVLPRPQRFEPSRPILEKVVGRFKGNMR